MEYFVMGLVVLSAYIYMSFRLYPKIEDFSGSDYLLNAFLFIAFWMISYLFYLSEVIEETAITWHSLGFVGRSIAYASLLIFAVKHTNPFNKLRSKFVSIFFIIPIITSILAITVGQNEFLFASIEIPQILPNKIIVFTPGIWFYVDFIYNIFCLSVPIVLFYKNYQSAPLIFRGQNIMYILGYLIIIIFQITSFLGIFSALDINILGTMMGSYIIFWALINYKASDFRIFAKDAVFEKISCACLLLDINGTIMDYNPEAKKIFSFIEDLEGMKYAKLKKNLINLKSASFNKQDDSEKLKISGREKQMFYDIYNSSIKDRFGKEIGTFIEIRDVTKQEELILELYRLANYDSLTNLYNRRYFEKMCEEYDNEKYYPLSIVSGDLNKLKYTNDTFGHQEGDRLIILISQILRETAPQNAVVSRHGGDEFLVLLPNTSEGEVKRYISNINKICDKTEREPFGKPSIALGYAVKTDKEQKIEELMLNADVIMYETKKKLQKTISNDFVIDSRLNFK